MNDLQKGFTLVELLIVITIIGILSGVVTWNLANAKIKSRDTRRKQDLEELVKAVNLYYSQNGSLPGPNCATVNAQPAFKNAIVPAYIAKLPADPILANQTGDYLYKSNDSNKGQFQVCASMENSASSNGAYDYSSPPCNQIIYNYCLVQS